MLLAVIPARGGSKGIPQKNIKSICGKPLIYWSIKAALESSLIDRVVVSTDNEEISAIAIKYGAKVLMRPSSLATDEAKTISVLEHVSENFPEAEDLLVLQPTSPLREKNLIDDCTTTYRQGSYDNLATGYYCKYREYGTHNNERRQDYKGFFYDDGSIYILNKSIVKRGNWTGEKICCKENPKYMNFEIDDPVDFLILETLMNNYMELL